MATSFRSIQDIDSTLANDAVSTAKIADGAIVNADINASADIAMSKLNNTYATTAGTTYRDVLVNSDSAGRVKVNGVLYTPSYVLADQIQGASSANVVKLGNLQFTFSADAPSGGSDSNLWVRVAGASTAMYINIDGSWKEISHAA